jgi:ABC-type branched-subunit amino acid transport system substrate-binding protein
VYRIPSTDDLQGPALVRFLVTKGYSDVFLLIEPGDYTQNVLSSFMDLADGRVRLVGSVQFPVGNDTFDAKQVVDSNAEAIVFLGGITGLERIFQGLEQANLDIPIVGLDSLNDPKVASFLVDGQELFFTSPIYVNRSIPGPYQELPAYREAGLYSLEGVQATWFILQALSSDGTDGFGRNAVWENLSGATIRGLDGGLMRWDSGQLSPMSIYVYRGTAREADWFFKPVFVFHTQ